MQAANRNLSDMSNTLAAQFTVSDTGALVYVTGGAVPAADRSLAWVDRQGTSQALAAPPRPYLTPRLSPDGQHVAVSTQQDIRQVWSYDIARSALSPITVDGQSAYGVFSPDGKRVVFRSGAAGGEDNLYWKAADGSGAAERLTTSARSQTPASWSPDGTTLAFVEEGETLAQQFFQFDIWVLSIGDRKTRAVDPDGRQRDVTRVFPGRPLAGVRLERIRTQRSLRAAISRPRRTSPDFHERRRATSVEREWSGTVLCASRGVRQPEAHVRQDPDGPGIPGGNARNTIRER